LLTVRRREEGEEGREGEGEGGRERGGGRERVGEEDHENINFCTIGGAFNQAFRKGLTHNLWLPDIKERAIPVSAEIDPLAVLADDAKIAEWKNQGLPADKQSEVQNYLSLSSPDTCLFIR